MNSEILELCEAEQVDSLQHSVLVIEDDMGIADVLAYRLEKQGYRTQVASTGYLGFELALQHKPSLILLDLRLPDIDGFEVCQKLDEQPDTSDIPVIILSGMEKPDIIRHTRNAGGNYFIRKPYDPNALLILIEHAIREASEY